MKTATPTVCRRCRGFGMETFKHVAGGVCFECGRMPGEYAPATSAGERYASEGERAAAAAADYAAELAAAEAKLARYSAAHGPVDFFDWLLAGAPDA